MTIRVNTYIILAIWAIGVYFGLTSSSDPAGATYAVVLPIFFALFVSFPFALIIARTPVPENATNRKLLKFLHYLPLTIVFSPFIILVVGFLIELLLYVLK